MQRRPLLEAALVIAAFAAYLYPAWDRAWLLTFQTRDILRAQDVLRGHPIFFGPEVTGGGYLPGGLYYYLVALPLAFGLGWKGTWLLIVALQSLTAGLLWAYFRARSASLLLPAFALACFATALPISLSSLLILNSACVFLPSAVILAGLSIAYTPETRDPERALACVFFAFATGVQMHLSVLALLPPLLMLQLAGPSLKLARVPWNKFLRGLLFLFPLFPWLVWRAARELHVPLGQQPPAFAELSGLGNFVKYSYGNFTQIAWEANRYYGGFWYAAGQMLYLLHHYVLDVGPLIWVCYAALAWGARRALKDAQVRIFLLCVASALVPGIVTMGAGAMGSRYLGVTSVAWIFFATAVLGSATKNLRPLPAWALAMLVGGYVALYGPRSARLTNELAGGPAFTDIVPASELESASRFIVTETGWPYSELRERAFLLNVFNEMTIQANYEEAATGATKRSASLPDGYFIARRMTPEDRVSSQRDLRAWLISQEVPANIAAGLKDGGIVVGAGAEFGSLVVVPYRVKNLDRYPPYFQNRSEHYESTQEERIDQALGEKNTRVALFNHCPTESPHCRIAIVARSADFRDPAQPLEIEVLGVPISHPTQHYSPAWTEAILDPFVSYRCAGGGPAQKEVIAPAVGFYVVYKWITNHTFLAPYRRTLRLRCPSGRAVEELTLGYREATSTSHMRVGTVPGQERRFPLPP